ncbi:MAG: cysteine--tRNA ligase [Candidatus Parcubacteria bacterium]|nr:MAG: cysteine--tRNA ligase [Candidatus Parcubacteria bacterium]
MWMLGYLAAQSTEEEENLALPLVRITGTPQAGRSIPACADEDPESEVRIYTCGPTVYDAPHIGNLRAFVVADTLHRALRARGHTVRHTINLTDFGHLTSDADEGEDKMMLALEREGLPRTMEAMKQIADRYAEVFFADLDALLIPRDRYIFSRASDYVPAMTAIVRTLLERGYAYTTPDGVYFDVATFPEYGLLGNVRAADKEAGVRVAPNPHKHHPEDFALWKFSSDPTLGWEAPWGRGFPGWHTECVAMIFDTLGRSIHFHTGGEDHIAVHHNNEIAQAEAITGKPLSRCWIHNAFVQVEGKKISKSIGNVVKREHIEDRGYPPLALRYLFLQAHYRSPINFTWQSMEAAHHAYRRLREKAFSAFREQMTMPSLSEALATPEGRGVYDLIADDLKTPQALAFVWRQLESARDARQTRNLLVVADELLGLGLTSEKMKKVFPLSPLPREQWPEEVAQLVAQRESLRKGGKFTEADALREAIRCKGFELRDTSEGTILMSKDPA